PPHPLWEHFETFHVLMQPTYASKYPPGQGLVLALGQLAGHPILGAILSCGLAIAATSWMLRGWIPQKWAVFVTFLVAINPGLQMRWGHSYWGGYPPMLGACLIFGGIPRFLAKQRPRDALAIAVGISILALTRPVEGLLITVLAAGVFCVEARRRGTDFHLIIRRGILPGIPVLALTLGFLAYNNVCVTGNWRTFPYQFHNAEYSPGLPMFLWQPIGSPVSYRHQAIEDFYTRQFEEVTRQKNWTGLLEIKG